jgi:hypothetical protein
LFLSFTTKKARSKTTVFKPRFLRSIFRFKRRLIQIDVDASKEQVHSLEMIFNALNRLLKGKIERRRIHPTFLEPKRMIGYPKRLFERWKWIFSIV